MGASGPSATFAVTPHSVPAADAARQKSKSLHILYLVPHHRIAHVRLLRMDTQRSLLLLYMHSNASQEMIQSQRLPD